MKQSFLIVYFLMQMSFAEFCQICRQVTRVANAKEDDLEALYERRLRKKALEKDEDKGLEVDSVDALPVKSLDGKLYYRTGLCVSLSFSFIVVLKVLLMRLFQCVALNSGMNIIIW